MALRFWKKKDTIEEGREEQQAYPSNDPPGPDALPGSAGYRGGIRDAKHPERFTYSPIRPEPRDERGDAP